MRRIAAIEGSVFHFPGAALSGAQAIEYAFANQRAIDIRLFEVELMQFYVRE